ncbi:MAG: putative toxin-antitoxin system toxin component, PIN family [Halioglobus sp.]
MSEKVVIDTSVMVSALIGKRGASRELIRRCLAGEHLPLISNPLFQEYEDVSSRKRIREACPLGAGEIRDLLNAFYSVCSWVPIYYLWRPNLKDEDDNFLIELAMAGNSQTIVTNNVKDFVAAELRFEDLRILTPGQILRGE